MSSNTSRTRNRIFTLGGLSVALLIAVFLSPLASKNPDGLDRASKDLKFDTKELKEKPAHKLPFYAVFNEYALRGVPEPMATPLAGLFGTLATFGVAFGISKLAVRNSSSDKDSLQEQQTE